MTMSHLILCVRRIHNTHTQYTGTEAFEEERERLDQMKQGRFLEDEE